MLYFIGPVGSGKTSMLDHMKRSLEASGVFYALEGCPINEEPLHLIPNELRSRWADAIGVPCREAMHVFSRPPLDNAPLWPILELQQSVIFEKPHKE